jgi:thiamine-phosphate pyrophosphorylase
MVSGGASFIQLRDKSAPAGDFYNSALEVLDFTGDRGVKIIINDRVDIALASGADGVHLGQDDLPAQHAREILGQDAIIGVSTHSVEQFRAALNLPVDYIAIGPIFATSTKSDTDPVVGLEIVSRVSDLARNVPIVAIGGIHRGNSASVLMAGADSNAIISDVLAQPEKITDRIRELFSSRPIMTNDVGNP